MKIEEVDNLVHGMLSSIVIDDDGDEKDFDVICGLNDSNSVPRINFEKIEIGTADYDNIKYKIHLRADLKDINQILEQFVKISSKQFPINEERDIGYKVSWKLESLIKKEGVLWEGQIKLIYVDLRNLLPKKEKSKWENKLGKKYDENK